MVFVRTLVELVASTLDSIAKALDLHAEQAASDSRRRARQQLRDVTGSGGDVHDLDLRQVVHAHGALLGEAQVVVGAHQLPSLKPSVRKRGS